MYEQEISRHNPGCFLFLLDQSYSMGAPISGSSAAKAFALASMINELLYAIVLECTNSWAWSASTRVADSPPQNWLTPCSRQPTRRPR